MNALPDTSGLKNEIVIQRLHRNDYDRALRVAGAKSSRLATTTSHFLTSPERADRPNSRRLLSNRNGRTGIAVDDRRRDCTQTEHSGHCRRRRGATAGENLRHFISQGADLVAFSGGKHIEGPQSTGILCGKKEPHSLRQPAATGYGCLSRNLALSPSCRRGTHRGPAPSRPGTRIQGGEGRDRRAAYRAQTLSRREIWMNELRTWSARIQIYREEDWQGWTESKRACVYPRRRWQTRSRGTHSSRRKNNWESPLGK